MTTPTLRINPELLRLLRERTGLSIRQLGELSGVSFSQIAYLERGEGTKQNPATVKKLADALAVPITAITTTVEPEAVEA